MTTSAALAQSLGNAARILARVCAGRSLSEELLREPALIDLTHGTLRRYGRVQGIVAALSRRGRPDAMVEALLWCSLYALDSGRYAEYTVVDQAVKACGLIKRWSAKGYVNGLLRSFIRERAAIERRLESNPEARYQHPRWWINLLRASHPSAWETVLARGNDHPPMCLRVNRRRSDVASYAKRLAALGLAARPIGAHGLLLEQPLPVGRLPGFDEGEVSVQDAGAQRAAVCLDLSPGQLVLDACAAPGGKTAHILELADVALTALDADAQRSARISRNLLRLGLGARVEVGDALEPQQWWDGRLFDRILADLPCSASGVARRHPDIKWLRRASDVDSFAARQASFLDALWRVLRPGGKLLYATCSVFPQENDAVTESFVGRTPYAKGLALPDGAAAQWLPHAEHDGFYYALIEKNA